MIYPVNGHILIEPMEHEQFISTTKGTYEEIGTVVAAADDVISNLLRGSNLKINLIGNKVYFDSWLAVKYPKKDSDAFYWLVKWDDVRATEYDLYGE